MKKFLGIIIVSTLGLFCIAHAQTYKGVPTFSFDPATIKDGKCTFAVQIKFPSTVYGVPKDPAPEPSGFTRLTGVQTLLAGQQSYTIPYSISDGNGPKTFNISINEGAACLAATADGGGCATYNEVGSGSKEIKCESGATNTAGGSDSGCEGYCCNGIKLNTNVPFIGDCIVLSDKEGGGGANTTVVTDKTAFPTLMMGLTKILVTVILLASFIAIIIAGVMIASAGGGEGASKGRTLIRSVITALALLGASGVILRLINPNFFG